MKEDTISGGKGDKSDPSKFDKAELHVGVAVEMEHTDDKKKALEIALDHLTEDPKYYSKLIKSGLADEKEAIELAKKYGMIGENKMDESRLRQIIREGIKSVLKEAGDKPGFTPNDAKELKRSPFIVDASVDKPFYSLSIETKNGDILGARNIKGKIYVWVQGYKTDIEVGYIGKKLKDIIDFAKGIDQEFYEDNDPNYDSW